MIIIFEKYLSLETWYFDRTICFITYLSCKGGYLHLKKRLWNRHIRITPTQERNFSNFKLNFDSRWFPLLPGEGRQRRLLRATGRVPGYVQQNGSKLQQDDLLKLWIYSLNNRLFKTFKTASINYVITVTFMSQSN